MKVELNGVITMNKPLSTYERKMKDAKFKKAYQQGYQELLFSELMISLMEGDDKSVRKLAEEAGLSPSVIQDIRSGKQHDIKVSNLIKIARAFGFAVVLENKGKRLTLKEKRKHLSVIAEAS